MSAPRTQVVALWCADDPDPSARAEVLRVLVALRASGRPLRVFDLRAGPPLVEPPLPDSDQRLLDALHGDGVAFERPTSPLLRAALAGAGSVVRLAAARRAWTPAVLAIDETWLAEASDGELNDGLVGAGLLVRRTPTA